MKLSHSKLCLTLANTQLTQVLPFSLSDSSHASTVPLLTDEISSLRLVPPQSLCKTVPPMPFIAQGFADCTSSLITPQPPSGFMQDDSLPGALERFIDHPHSNPLEITKTTTQGTSQVWCYHACSHTSADITGSSLTSASMSCQSWLCRLSTQSHCNNHSESRQSVQFPPSSKLH